MSQVSRDVRVVMSGRYASLISENHGYSKTIRLRPSRAGVLQHDTTFGANSSNTTFGGGHLHSTGSGEQQLRGTGRDTRYTPCHITRYGRNRRPYSIMSRRCINTPCRDGWGGTGDTTQHTPCHITRNRRPDTIRARRCINTPCRDG